MDTKIHALHHPVLPANTKTHASKNTGQFAAMLQRESELSISKHAQQRMSERNIEVSEYQWSKINEKVMEAKQKGVNDSLVLLENAALIINAKSNTVITALEKAEMHSRIFTNINGTIVMD